MQGVDVGRVFDPRYHVQTRQTHLVQVVRGLDQLAMMDVDRSTKGVQTLVQKRSLFPRQIDLEKLLNRMLVQIHNLLVLHVFGDKYLAKPRQNRVQQLVLVLDQDEEPRVVAEQLNAPPQGRLGINRQIIRIDEHNRLENGAIVRLDVGLREKLEFFADEFDALALGTVDNHHIGLYFVLVALVNLVEELVDDGTFARARCSVENDVRNLVLLVEIVEFRNYFLVDGEEGATEGGRHW